MFNLANYIKQLRTKRKISKLQRKPARSVKEFRKKYPTFHIGENCYGVPVIRHEHENAKVTIAEYCSIARNVQIFLGGNHRTDWISTYPFQAFFTEAKHIKNMNITKGDVIIGNDVWLCQDCTILSGITIGDGAVVANGAVVTKDVAPYSIVGGNPAKHIRWRFNEETRQALLDSAWWNWPQEEVLKVVDLICSDDMSAYLDYAKNRK